MTALRVRKMAKREQWTKRCPSCTAIPVYIPDEYAECDNCLLASLNLRATYDSEDREGMCPMYNEADVLRVIRNLRGETYVEFK